MVDKILDFVKTYKVAILGLVAIIATITIGLTIRFLAFPDHTPPTKNLYEISTMIDHKQVASATLYDSQRIIEVTATDGTKFQSAFLSDGGQKLIAELQTAGTPYSVKVSNVSTLGELFNSLIWILVILVIAIPALALLGKWVNRKMSGGMGGKSDYRAERPNVRFADLVGVAEAIDEATVLVDYLRYPTDYAGIKMERGILLHGPTGTGKTMLAKAIAGEAGVPFYKLSGSDLTSQWVGGSTQRILGFFDTIEKEQNPDRAFVVFIDELDGIASKRTGGEQSAEHDHNSSVTQLLHRISEMFDRYPLAIIIGATNRLDILDDAVKRPDRLGLHIAVPNPDSAARKVLLERNSDKLDMDENVSLSVVAGLTYGMSGAALANIPSKAAIVARKKQRTDGKILTHDIEQAAMEIAAGTLRWSAEVPVEDRILADVHEAGHAVLAQRSPYHQLAVITDVPIGQSGGSTWSPPVERMGHTVESLVWDIAVKLGGRQSEIVEFGEPSSGAQSDLDVATERTRTAVCEWGLFDEFLARIDVQEWQNHPRAAEIDAKVNQLLKQGKDLAEKVLQQEREFRRAIIKKLDECRIIHSDEIDTLDPQPVTYKVIVADGTEPVLQAYTA